MTKLVGKIAALAFVGLIAGGGGFFRFAERVRQLTADPGARADGIVVLTGDEERIATGVRLMIEGRGARLLISGVNPITRVPSELRRRIEGGSDQARIALVKCCVDIGHEALNTIGNADEARQWTKAHGFRSLLVVTSGYHMPRGLAEFGRAMPEIALVPYPVKVSRNLRLDAWWTHWPTIRLLAGEYVKFLGSSARHAIGRLGVRQSDDTGRTLPAPAAHTSASVSSRPAP